VRKEKKEEMKDWEWQMDVALWNAPETQSDIKESASGERDVRSVINDNTQDQRWYIMGYNRGENRGTEMEMYLFI